MRFRLGFGIGLGVGYVMGTKAGREQYERIMGATSKLWASDAGAKVRAVADQVTEQVASVVESVIEREEAGTPANPSNGKI